MLNYVAALKAVKKHDKVQPRRHRHRHRSRRRRRPSPAAATAPPRLIHPTLNRRPSQVFGTPLRQELLEHLFSLPFVRSLDHSFLFEECWRCVSEAPSSASGALDNELAASIRQGLDAMRRLKPDSITEREIERMLGADGNPEAYFLKAPRCSRDAAEMQPRCSRDTAGGRLRERGRRVHPRLTE